MPRRLLQKGHRFALAVTVTCMLMIFISMGVAGGALLFRGQDQQATNRAVCVAVNNLNNVISQTLKRSKKNIGRLTYYKDHPQEAAQQRKEINRTLLAFRPRTCE